MLRIYDVALDWIGSLSPAIRAIGRFDSHLADQLRRSSTSVVLNLAEGMAATGRMKTAAYRIALREMRESMAALAIAVRLEYLAAPGDETRDRQERIVATLVRLAKVRG